MPDEPMVKVQLMLDGTTVVAYGEIPARHFGPPFDHYAITMHAGDYIQRTTPLLKEPAHFLHLEIVRGDSSGG